MRRWVSLMLMLLASAAVGLAATCTLSNSTVNLGSYTGVLSQAGRGASTANCTSGTTYDVGINSGQHQGPGNYNWNMLGPNGALLHYQLFWDAARTQIWGNSSGYDTVHGTGNGSSQTISIYPQLPANQYVAAGTYSDSITAYIYGTSAPTTTATFTVNATVIASCSIAASNLDFGIYSGAKVDATTTLTVTCTNTTAYQIGADNGQNAAYIGVYAKYMLGPSGAKLRYHLYPDAARSIEWGTTAGTNEVAGTGTGSAQTITVYGTIGAGSYASAPGSYSDIVTLTITY